MSAPDAPAATVPDQVTISGERLAHLENVNREYNVTINTLGIVVEKLLAATGGGDTLYISPEERLRAPDLRAGADADGRIWIRVTQ